MTRIIIRAIPERKTDVDYLLKHIPDAEVCWETHETDCIHTNIWNTFTKALKMAGDGPCVQMEEDVILTKNFREKLETAISERPNDVINFFSMRDFDSIKGSRWDTNFMMAQCWYAPPYFCQYLLKFMPYWEHKKIAYPNAVDLLVHDLIKAFHSKYRIHCPSLVDHRERASYIDTPGRSRDRVSHTFVDPIEE